MFSQNFLQAKPNMAKLRPSRGFPFLDFLCRVPTSCLSSICASMDDDARLPLHGPPFTLALRDSTMQVECARVSDRERPYVLVRRFFFFPPASASAHRDRAFLYVLPPYLKRLWFWTASRSPKLNLDFLFL